MCVSFLRAIQLRPYWQLAGTQTNMFRDKRHELHDYLISVRSDLSGALKT